MLSHTLSERWSTASLHRSALRAANPTASPTVSCMGLEFEMTDPDDDDFPDVTDDREPDLPAPEFDYPTPPITEF